MDFSHGKFSSNCKIPHENVRAKKIMNMVILYDEIEGNVKLDG